MIAIKDMEVPTSCKDCELAKHFDGYQDNDCPFNAFSYYDCPLIEVPEPHGRLGDLTAIEDQLDYIANLDWNKQVGASGGMLAALEVVEDAPTIIPASEEGE